MSRLHSTSRSTAVFHWPNTTIALAAIACTLAGCGAMTTAPVATTTASRAQTVAATSGTRQMAPEDGDGGDTGGDVPAGGGTGDAGTGVPVAASDVLTTFNARHAATGSVVSRTATAGAVPVSIASGRWRLDVPANAFAASVRLTLSASNSRGPACELQTQPADPGAFASPLTLSVDTRGAASNHTSDFVILAYDAASESWHAVPGSRADKKKKSVSAPVTALGIFGVGYADGTPAW